MKYTATHVDGHLVVLPEPLAAQDDLEHAVGALLQGAWPHYDRAIRALHEKRIPAAVHSAALACRLAPYSPRVVELGLALSVRHGDFEWAQQLLAWAKKTGMEGDWAVDYNAALQEAVAQWNRYLVEPASLRTQYQSDSTKPSYRELLLLAHHIRTSSTDPVTPVERTFLDAYGVGPLPRSKSTDAAVSASSSLPRWGPARLFIATGVACVLGLAVGVSGLTLIQGGSSKSVTADTASGSSALVTTTGALSPTPDAALDKLAQVTLYLAKNRPRAAHDTLMALKDDTLTAVRHETFESLHTAAYEELFAAGVAAWQERDYARVVQMLEPVERVEVGTPQQKFYYLGIAAAKIGRTTLAIRSLQQLQPHLDADHPHFDAQAAYTLVQLLPDNEAQLYARHIADTYRHTIYFNSVVRAHL